MIAGFDMMKYDSRMRMPSPSDAAQFGFSPAAVMPATRNVITKAPAAVAENDTSVAALQAFFKGLKQILFAKNQPAKPSGLNIQA